MWGGEKLERDNPFVQPERHDTTIQLLIVMSCMKEMQPAKKRPKRELTEEKRKQRNAKEQARSIRLSQQIDELRVLLTHAGIVVPKGTKGCVLTASLEYIKLLQNSNHQREM